MRRHEEQVGIQVSRIDSGASTDAATTAATNGNEPVAEQQLHRRHQTSEIESCSRIEPGLNRNEKEFGG